MNHQASMALEHWRTWLPTRFAQIPDPQTFFAELGEETADQIAQLSEGLAEIDPPGEGYLDKRGRLNAAEMQAEEMVLRDLVLLPAEPGTDPDLDEDDLTQTEPTSEMVSPWAPVIEDSTHPYWQRQS